MITGGQSRAAHPHDHHCDNDHNHHREHDHDHHIMVGVGSTISPEHQRGAAHPLPSDSAHKSVARTHSSDHHRYRHDHHCDNDHHREHGHDHHIGYHND